jgi:hypothetical protein
LFCLKHLKEVQSTGSTQILISIILFTTIQHPETCNLQDGKSQLSTGLSFKIYLIVLIDQKNCCDNHSLIDNANANSVTVMIDKQTKFPLQSKGKHFFNYSSTTQRFLLLFIPLSIILTEMMIGGFIWIIQLKWNYNNLLNEQTKNNVSRYNGVIQLLLEKVQHVDEKQSEITNNHLFLAYLYFILMK